MRRSIKSAFALVALLGGLAAVPALSAQGERGPGPMMGPDGMMGGMMPMMGMMQQMSRMMAECEKMMEGMAARPNEEWRDQGAPAPEGQ